MLRHAACGIVAVDLARVVHSAHASLLEKHNGQRAGSKLFMKLDVEGSETSILLHLVRSQALCIIDKVQIEWHNAVPDWMAGVQGDAGVSMLANVTKEAQLLFRRVFSATHSGCRTRLSEMDDETYYKDGQPWPSEAVPICKRERARLSEQESKVRVPSVRARPWSLPSLRAEHRATSAL